MSDEDELNGLDSDECISEEDDEDFDFDPNDEAAIAALEAEVAELEQDIQLTEEEERQMEEEVMIDLELSGNVFVGAMLRPKYAHFLTNLQEEIAEEELEKSRTRSFVPKYLVNPFALKNRLDYEEIFDEIDPEEPTLMIWRIDDFEPVPVSEKKFGKFYSADCYVILYITEEEEGEVRLNIHHWIGAQATTDKIGAAAFRAVELNMYLGGRCHIYRELESEESRLFVDYFFDSIEYLVGGSPCSFNHVEANTEPHFTPKLYQLVPQSSGNMALKLVEFSYQTLDSDFVFILDSGPRIFQWNGAFTKKKYRVRGSALAQSLRSERSGRPLVFTFPEGNIDDNLAYEESIFWNLLKGKKNPPALGEKPAPKSVMKRFLFYLDEEVECDIDPSEQILAVNVLGSWDNYYYAVPMVKNSDGDWDLQLPLTPGEYYYRYKVATPNGVKPACDPVRPRTEVPQFGQMNVVVSAIDLDEEYVLYGTLTNAAGKMDLRTIEFDELTNELLDTVHAHILDCQSEMFVWVGRNCKFLEKRVAVALAKQLYKAHARPSFSMISLVHENSETVSFKSKFARWRTPAELLERERRRNIERERRKNRKVSFSLSSIVNVESHLRELKPESEPMIDNGAGVTEVHLFTLKDGFVQEKISPNRIGLFYTGSSYVVMYKYEQKINNRTVPKFMIYFWSGILCKDALASYARFSMELLPKLLERVGRHRISHMWVQQGKEPKHFMRIFNGQIVIKQGLHQESSQLLQPIALYDVVISSLSVGYPRMHLIEVDRKTSSLASARCFILVTPKKVFVWSGKHTFPEEKEMASEASEFICNLNLSSKSIKRDLVLIEQGAPESLRGTEATEFWEIVQGDQNLICQNRKSTGRLYAIGYQLGFFEVAEIRDYAQCDLMTFDRSMLLLHTPDTVFLWRGSQTTPSLMKLAMNSAEEWICSVCDLEQRDSPQRAMLQEQAKESLEFKQYFPGWQEYSSLFHDRPETLRASKLTLMETIQSIKQKSNFRYEKLQSKLELLEAISSSCSYSKAEERAADPNFGLIRPSFDSELIELGLMKAPPAPPRNVLQEFRDSVEREETFFHWKTPGALAVSLKGSWNNWQQIPMINVGKDGFVCKALIPPGKYRYRYIVAHHDRAESAVDDDHPITEVNTGDDPKHNVLWVYLCENPEYLAEQRKRQEQEAEQKRRKEEELKKPITLEEIRKSEKAFKEEQRRAHEERLRRQLEEKRKNRLLISTPSTDVLNSTDLSTTSSKADDLTSYSSRDRPSKNYTAGRTSDYSSTSSTSRNRHVASILDETPKRSSLDRDDDSLNTRVSSRINTKRYVPSSALTSPDDGYSSSAKNTTSSSSYSDDRVSSILERSRARALKTSLDQNKPPTEESSSSRSTSTTSDYSAPASQEERERRRLERRRALGLE